MPHTKGPWTAISLEMKDGVLCFENEADIPLVLAAPQMYELLKEMEWTTSMFNSNPICPSCDRGEESGHDDDCKLAAVLKAVEGEKGAS
jgi:hypothetical protein